MVVLSITTSAVGCDRDDRAPAGPRGRHPPNTVPEPAPIDVDCGEDDPTIVEQTFLTMLGMRPLGVRDAAEAAAVLTSARAAEPDPLRADDAGRRALVEALSLRDGYLERWSDFLLDHLRVPRMHDRERLSMLACYGARTRSEDDGGALARHVATVAATEDAMPPGGPYTMADLIRSSLTADDVSPVFFAHVVAMMSSPIWPANARGEERERLRRADFGRWFDDAMLGRDLECLRCHHGEGGVTWSADDVANRHWALPGHLERAVWGSSASPDPDAAHAALRYEGFVSGALRPWGWASACGTVRLSPATEIAPVSARLGSVHGIDATTLDVERALRHGMSILSARGLELEEDGTARDPDVALAFLVAARFVDGVFEEAIGAPLTIAHHVSRTRAQRDVLVGLTLRFARSGYSLRALLGDIATSGFFAQGECASALPAVVDPWADPDADGERRNDRDDLVVPLPARTLLRAAWIALEWPIPLDRSFPTEGSAEAELQRAIGTFLRHSDPGFRGLDVQALLAWERAVGECLPPAGVEEDFVSRAVRQASDESWTIADLVAAIQARLLGRAEGIPRDAELVGHVFGAPPEAQVEDLEAAERGARRLCGAILTSPRFLLAGTRTP